MYGPSPPRAWAVAFWAASLTASTSMPSTWTLGMPYRAPHARPHAVLVVLDHVDDRQLPQRRHVERFGDLALVDRAIAQVGHRDQRLLAVAVRKREAGADRHLGADDAVAAVEILLAAEHVHRAALALRVAAAASGQLGHDATR